MRAKVCKTKPKTMAAAARELLTDADAFTMEIYDAKTTPEQKVNLLGALLLSDYMFFERDTDACSCNPFTKVCAVTFFDVSPRGAGARSISSSTARLGPVAGASAHHWRYCTSDSEGRATRRPPPRRLAETCGCHLQPWRDARARSTKTYETCATTEQALNERARRRAPSPTTARRPRQPTSESTADSAPSGPVHFPSARGPDLSPAARLAIKCPQTCSP